MPEACLEQPTSHAYSYAAASHVGIQPARQPANHPDSDTSSRL